MQNVGNTFKKLRKKHNFTQNELAKYLNTSQSYIAKIENNKIQIKDDVLKDLCILYNLDENDIYEVNIERKYNFKSNVENLNLNTIAKMNKILRNIEYLSEVTKDLE